MSFSRNLLTVFLSLIAVSANANVESVYVDLIARTLNYEDKHSRDVWPGFNLSTIPDVIYLPNSNHFYAFDIVAKNPNWQSMKIAGRQAYFMSDNYLNIETNAYSDFWRDPYTNIDGQNTFIDRVVLGTDASDVEIYYEEFLAEVFYAYFHPHLKFKNEVEYSYVNTDVENIKLMYLEIAVLKDYLKTNNTETLKTALAIKQSRMKLLDKLSANFEKINEIEGTMEYVIHTLASNLTTQSRNAELGNEINSYICQLHGYQNEPIHPNAFPICLEEAPLHIGPVHEIALDSLHIKGWQKSVALGTDPGTLLLQHFPMSEIDVSQRIAKAKNDYYYESTSPEFETALKNYQDQRDQLQADYKSSPGIEIQLEIINKNELLFPTFEPPLLLAPDIMIFSQINSASWDNINSSTKISFGVLPYMIESTSYSLKPNQSGEGVTYSPKTTVQFKMDPSTPVILNGTQTTLGTIAAKNSNTNFNSLDIQNNGTSIEMKSSGHMTTNNNTVHITLKLPEVKRPIFTSLGMKSKGGKPLHFHRVS